MGAIRGWSTIAVGEVALHFVHPGWRMGGISAVADEAAHFSPLSLVGKISGSGLADMRAAAWLTSINDCGVHFGLLQPSQIAD